MIGKKSQLAVLLSLAISACVTVVPGISDIDKSQPSVSISGFEGTFSLVDWDAGQRKAQEQCKEFGYTRADPLEFQKKSGCGQYGCTITRKFICRK